MKTISLRISNEFDRRLRIQAAQVDQNRSEFIRMVLTKRMAGYSNPAKVHPRRKRQAVTINREKPIEQGALPARTSARIAGRSAESPHTEVSS